MRTLLLWDFHRGLEHVQWWWWGRGEGNFAGQRVVVVSHGGILRSLHIIATGLPSRGKVLNASINTFCISDTKDWTMCSFGDVQHLQDVGYLSSAFGGDQESGWHFIFFQVSACGGGGDSIVWGLNSCQYGLWLMKPWKSRHVGYSDWFRIEIVLVMSLFYLGRCTISLKWLLCLCYSSVGYLVSRLPKKFITLKWNYYTINKVLHDQHFHVSFFGNSHCLCTSCLWEKLPATRCTYCFCLVHLRTWNESENL